MTLPKVWIFDLDGTLADTYEANFQAYQTVFADHEMPMSRAQYATYFGLGFRDMLLRHTAASGVTPTESLIAACGDEKQLVYRNLMHLVRPVPAGVALLAACHGRVHVALATTARRSNAETVLDHLGIRDQFELIVCGEDVGQSKPSPECFEVVADYFEVDATECLVIEDSETGMRAARAFGSAIVRVVQP